MPSPLLIESDQAIVIFVSDGSIHGRGFEFTFSAVHPASEAGNFTFASGPLCGGQLGNRQLLALYLFSKNQVDILPPFAYCKCIEVEKELNVDLPVNKVQMMHITSLLICCCLSCSNVVGSGCGSVAMLVEEGKIDTANYPGLYPSSTKCHWLIEAPVDCVIKVIRSNDLGWNTTNFFVMPMSGSHKSFLRQLSCLSVFSKNLKLLLHWQSKAADDFGGQEREIDYYLIRCY